MTTTATTRCPACSQPTSAEALFCSQCGKPLGLGAASPAARWYHNIWFVLAMIFFVMGPFALPLVWKNPRFSRSVQWALTVVCLLYTIGLLKMMVDVANLVIGQLNTSFTF